MDEQTRNLNPHAEARLAMAVWGDEYAAQRGGTMDFWDALSPSRKRWCQEQLSKIVETRRASLKEPTP